MSQLKETAITYPRSQSGTLDNKSSANAFRRRLEKSLERLKVDYLDFYYLWCMLDMESFKKHYDLLYKHFEKAKSDGLIRHITVSLICREMTWKRL